MPETNGKPTCSKRKYPDVYGCGKPGRVEWEGKWYCGIHDPRRAIARRKANDEKWRMYRLRSDAQQLVYERTNAVLAQAREVATTGSAQDVAELRARVLLLEKAEEHLQELEQP